LATSTSHAILTRIKGFSLIELLVVIGMLALLFSILIGILNPVAQLNKARDTQREHDLDQIKIGLDAYYTDNGCYPNSLTFGYQFNLGNVIYVKKIPQDFLCSSNTPTNCYLYETDITTTCPQWNVLYMKLANPVASANKVLCPLTQMTSCIPTNYTTLGYNYCTMSGSVNCTYINTNPLPSPFVATPTPTTPVISLTPTPVPPTPTPSCVPGYASLNYLCAGGPPPRCDIVPTGTGTYCGFPGCVAGQCCQNQCL